jgi:hypothetical protein
MGMPVNGPESKLVAETPAYNEADFRTNPKMGYEQTGQAGKLINVTYEPPAYSGEDSSSREPTEWPQ